jgi:hypothetical protein
VYKQSSGFPYDLVLEEKTFWLDMMLGEVIFQFEQRVEPFAVTCEDGYSILQYGEGWFVPCSHDFEFRIVKRYEPMETVASSNNDI